MFRVVFQNGLNERNINAAGSVHLFSINILLAVMNIFYEF